MNSGLRQKQLEGEKQIISREIEKHSHKPVLNCSKEPELGSRGVQLQSKLEATALSLTLPSVWHTTPKGRRFHTAIRENPAGGWKLKAPGEQLLASPARNI